MDQIRLIPMKKRVIRMTSNPPPLVQPSTSSEDIPLTCSVPTYRHTTTSDRYHESGEATAETSIIDGGGVLSSPIKRMNVQLKMLYPKYGERGLLGLKEVKQPDSNEEVSVRPRKELTPILRSGGEIRSRGAT